MARQYAQRLSLVSSQLLHLSSSKPAIAPSMVYLRPTINAHRLLTFSVPSQHQQHQQQAAPSVQHNQGPFLEPIAQPLVSIPFESRFPAQSSHASESAAKAVSGTNPGPLEASEEPNAPASMDCFQFVAHAAWHPKNRHPKQRQSENKLPYWKRPQVGKVDAGEDAFFHTYTSYGMALGVADGVGGWAEAGVDPALFSWTLMNNAAGVAKKAEPDPPIDALQILDAAFHQLRRGGKVAAGSSTACILNLCKTTGKMTSVNLGDSAFVLIRDKKIMYESPSQQHYFNCPYQLTVVPETYPDRDSFVTDMPKDADQKSFFLKDNDIILLATDGYFDNVYPHETLALVNATMKSVLESDTGKTDDEIAATVRTLAKTLTDTARRLSLDQKRLSPWAQAARAHGSNYRGGKVDDITCIVTLVRGIQNTNP